MQNYKNIQQNESSFTPASRAYYKENPIKKEFMYGHQLTDHFYLNIYIKED